MKMHKNGLRRGFTLIELLVVVAIIAVLATIVIISFRDVRMKSRDAKRYSDLSTVRSALNMYYNANHFYPTYITTAMPITDNTGGRVYLQQTPSNPLPHTDHGCPDTDYTYTIGPNNDSYSFTVCVQGSGTSLAKTVSVTEDGIYECGGDVSDRDNNVYTTVQVGGQCWLGSNLKTKTGPDNVLLTTGTDNSQRDCITTSNTRGTEADCDARGALYTSGTAATICPSGWHLPSDDEFAVMEQSVTGSGQSCSSERGVIIPSDMLGCPGTLPADSCSPAGYALKVGGNSGFNWTQIGYRKANRSKIAPYNVSVSFVDANTTGYLMTSKTGTCGLFGNVGAYPQTNNVVYRSISNASKGVIRKSEVSYSVNGEGDATVSTALPVRCILGN